MSRGPTRPQIATSVCRISKNTAAAAIVAAYPADEFRDCPCPPFRSCAATILPSRSALRRHAIGGLRLAAFLLQLVQRLRQAPGRELDVARSGGRRCGRSDRLGDDDVRRGDGVLEELAACRAIAHLD